MTEAWLSAVFFPDCSIRLFTFSNGDEYQGEMNGNIKSGEWNYINKINGKKMKVIFNNENNDVTYIY